MHTPLILSFRLANKTQTAELKLLIRNLHNKSNNSVLTFSPATEILAYSLRKKSHYNKRLISAQSEKTKSNNVIDIDIYIVELPEFDVSYLVIPFTKNTAHLQCNWHRSANHLGLHKPTDSKTTSVKSLWPVGLHKGFQTLMESKN